MNTFLYGDTVVLLGKICDECGDALTPDIVKFKIYNKQYHPIFEIALNDTHINDEGFYEYHYQLENKYDKPTHFIAEFCGMYSNDTFVDRDVFNAQFIE